MNLLDIFSQDAFSMATLTATINNVPHKSGRIGELGLFTDVGINTTTLSVESCDGSLQLLPNRLRIIFSGFLTILKLGLMNFFGH